MTVSKIDHALVDYLRSLPNQESPESRLFDGISRDTMLYRFMDLEAFCDMVANKKMILRKPTEWDDPFEDFISKTQIVYPDYVQYFELTGNYYGQCWTTKEECDGFWRNYCGGLSYGVRISALAGKLIDAVWQRADRVPCRCALGRVEYLSDTEIKARIRNWTGWLADDQGVGQAKSLLIKRKEFSWDSEVRVLIKDTSPDSKLAISIEPSDLIDNVMFAPNCGYGMRQVLRSYLIANGFDVKKIARSTLYDPWRIKISHK